jgi:hypothetical protein
LHSSREKRETEWDSPFYISVRVFHTSFFFLFNREVRNREQEEEEGGGGRHLPQDLFAANDAASSLCIAASLTYRRVRYRTNNEGRKGKERQQQDRNATKASQNNGGGGMKWERDENRKVGVTDHRRDRKGEQVVQRLG